MNRPIKKILILGGGSSGWMAAAMLSQMLGKTIDITLIESSEIGTVGVGEATIPPIKIFNQVLGLNELDFLKKTQGTIKLGIEFENWGREGDRYMHAFGSIGPTLGGTKFRYHWLRARHEGKNDSFWDYSLNYQAAKQNKFAPLAKIPDTNYDGLVYAYHFDAGLYAQMLRTYSEARGVKRIDSKILQVHKDPDSGHLSSVDLESNQRLEADLFIDCSGSRALLIGEALGVGYDDWSHWLPCDRAAAVPSEAVHPIAPYTRSIAREAGWQWRIPLQHRTGNGLVYSSRYLSEDEAAHQLVSNLDSAPLAEPRTIRFLTGRRRQQWHKNVVSLGLSSGFLEPLESTSLHLVQSGIIRLFKLFPRAEIQDTDVEEYNRQSKLEFESIRDFIILHYHLNDKPNSPFWKECRSTEKPESLLRRIALFAKSGHVFREQEELFGELAWEQVMLGQGIVPEDYHTLADTMTKVEFEKFLAGLKQVINKTTAKLPSHDQFLHHVQRSK